MSRVYREDEDKGTLRASPVGMPSFCGAAHSFKSGLGNAAGIAGVQYHYGLLDLEGTLIYN